MKTISQKALPGQRAAHFLAVYTFIRGRIAAQALLGYPEWQLREYYRSRPSYYNTP